MSATYAYTNFQTVFMKSLSLVWNDNVSYSDGGKYLKTISEPWQEVELIWAIAWNNRQHGWQVNRIEWYYLPLQVETLFSSVCLLSVSLETTW